MKYEKVLNLLQSYTPPAGWNSNLFLLPLDAIKDIYDFIIQHKPGACIELGTGFGVTACVMAAAMEEIGGGQVTTVDMYSHQPVNVEVLLQHTGQDKQFIKVVVDPLGYNWYMADLIQQQSIAWQCQPLFDFCLLDGAHEWSPDALAFFLIAKLLKPGAWIALDDINFKLRSLPDWLDAHPSYTDREMDTFQIGMVYNLVVRQHPEFTDFHITHNGRIGWARKMTPSRRAEIARGILNVLTPFRRWGW